MSSITLRSPAKLNLVLDVLAKRMDGFHELRTIFERIDLCDRITLTSRRDGAIKVVCGHPQVPKGPKNLAVKAAKQLQADFGIKQGVTIAIDKKIPVAAGLAGGSSNAAAVLMGLNRLWRLRLSQKQLVEYASRAGSDVAFFIYNASYALGEGRGEKIRVLPIRVKLWHVLVTAKFKMYTKEVFNHLNCPMSPLPNPCTVWCRGNDNSSQLTNKKDNVNILLPYLRKNMPQSIGSALANDLESAILSLRPDFKRLKNKLSNAGACGVCFSGSGPSVFALARSKQHAGQIKARFDRRYAQVFVVSTL
ncbi:MAG: 4-(cytidine 5'-diphospho)-2-C-methyl-D-erythritol kinase [Candidatus Omnitrophica bacterium]|nr:4-(cytidine 5'-diphospho)-2-C-methyl-D-erythritol kinase [Candidatus Omnitrophota bacterium]